MEKWNKYLELTKPKVTLLNILVGVTCFIFADYPIIDFTALTVFFIVAYMTAGGCGAINCYLDRDIDGLMFRTAKRAIPSGCIKPYNALLWGVILTLVGLSSTYVVFGLSTWVMVFLGALFYLIIYTIMLKRSTRWNVVIGALSGSFAALAGWTASGRTLSTLPIFIGILDFLWTPGHLWSLAIRRIEEYQQANVPMLPVKSGLRKTSQYIFIFNLMTFIFSILFTVLGLTGLLYTIVAIFSGLKLLHTSYKLLKSPSQDSGMKVFLASMPYLAFMMIGIMIDRIIPIKINIID
jgi:protoheme IX farnesyltransferase